MKRCNIFLTGIMLMLALSCTETKNEPEPIILLKGVTDVQVENLEGRARISWTLPSSGNVTGAKVIYSLITGGSVLETFIPKENNTIELRGFGDWEEHKVTIFAVYPDNNLSVGVVVTVKPFPTIYRPVSDVNVENMVGRATITYTLPPDEHLDEKLLGVNVIYSLTEEGETLEIFVPAESNSIELDGFNYDDEINVMLIAVYQEDNISIGIPAIVKPLPHISDIEVENLPMAAIISYTLSSDENLLGINVVYSLTEEDEIEIFVDKENNSIELSGFEDTDERMVTIYVVYNYKITTGFYTFIKPLPLSFNPVSEIQVNNFEGGAEISWTSPPRDDYLGAKVVFSYGSGGKEFEIFVEKTNNSIVLEGFSNSNQRTVTIYAMYIEDNISDGIDVDIKPEPLQEVPVEPIPIRGKIGNLEIWSMFDDDRVIPGDNTSPWRFVYRGDIFTPDNRATRTFSNILNNPWRANSGANYTVDGVQINMWQPGGDALGDQNLSTFVPGAAATDPIPYPLYITFDMGRKAIYSKMAYLIRTRGNNNFSANMPVEFVVWGSNNPKTIEQIGDGSREANLAYWTSWEVANGTDAWKNDWTQIATCKYTLSVGDNAGLNRVPLANNLAGEDLQRYQGVLPPFIEGSYGLGYDFDLTVEGNSEAFRYLRWEITLLNRDEQNTTGSDPNNRCLQMYALKYWGFYAED